jgi:hypothetical protein
MTKSYINSRTINHDVIYSYTLLYGFYQQLTNPLRFKMGQNAVLQGLSISGKCKF